MVSEKFIGQFSVRNELVPSAYNICLSFFLRNRPPKKIYNIPEN